MDQRFVPRVPLPPDSPPRQRRSEPPPPPSRWSFAPVQLAVGLTAGYVILLKARGVMASLFTQGAATGERLTGWARWIWDASGQVQGRPVGWATFLAIVVGISLALTIVCRGGRYVVWLASLVVIVVDALILVGAIATVYADLAR